MERFGFIRNKDDIKFLILYSLTFIKFPITFDNIYDVCTWCDEGFNYFEFNEAFLELISSNHLDKVDEKFQITEKGIKTAEEFNSRLPASVKDIVHISALRVIREIHRTTHIKTKTTKISDTDYVASLEMEGVFSLNFNVASPEQGILLESHFKKNAEKIYDDFLNSLTK